MPTPKEIVQIYTEQEWPKYLTVDRHTEFANIFSSLEYLRLEQTVPRLHTHPGFAEIYLFGHF